MALNEIRKTVLEIINEVQRKLALTESVVLTDNAQTKVLLDFLNDTVDEMADMDWPDTLATATVTAASGVSEYSVQTSAVIKSIEDIYFGTRTAPLNAVSIDDMRQRQRLNTLGQPVQFCINGVDANANPRLQVWPRPDASAAGLTFNVLFYTKPPIYTTSDGATVPPFPAKPLIYGTLNKALLDESGGAPTEQSERYRALYEQTRAQAVNRFKFKTGNEVRFKPRSQ